MRWWCVRWAMASGLAISLSAAVAGAADAPLVRKAPVQPPAPAFDWSGFYAGGHLGYSLGRTGMALPDNASPNGTSTFGSAYGVAQAGYNLVLPSGFLTGIEGDVSVSEFFENGAISRRPTKIDTGVVNEVDYIARLR